MIIPMYYAYIYIYIYIYVLGWLRRGWRKIAEIALHIAQISLTKLKIP